MGNELFSTQPVSYATVAQVTAAQQKADYVEDGLNTLSLYAAETRVIANGKLNYSGYYPPAGLEYVAVFNGDSQELTISAMQPKQIMPFERKIIDKTYSSSDTTKPFDEYFDLDLSNSFRLMPLSGVDYGVLKLRGTSVTIGGTGSAAVVSHSYADGPQMIYRGSLMSSLSDGDVKHARVFITATAIPAMLYYDIVYSMVGTEIIIRGYRQNIRG